MTNPPPPYFEGSRPEVANLVPDSCRYILDVGCGLGGPRRQLLSRPLKLLVDHIDICHYSVVAHKL